MLHVLQWLCTHVSSVCFICFGRLLQVFHLGIAKVELDVAYICKCFRCFHTYVASVSSGCYICFQWLHTCFQVFFVFFASVSDVCCKCLSCFGRMLQVFYLDIAKVEWVLHMLQRDPPAAATRRRACAGEVEGDGGRGAGGPCA